MRYTYEFGQTLVEQLTLLTPEEHLLVLHGIHRAKQATEEENVADHLEVLEQDVRSSLSRSRRGYEPSPFQGEDASKIDDIILNVANLTPRSAPESEQHWQAVAAYVIENAASKVVSQIIVLPEQRVPR